MRMFLLVAALVALGGVGNAQEKPAPKIDAPKIPPTMIPVAPNEVPTTADVLASGAKHATSHVILAPVPAGMVAVNDPTDGGRYLVPANDVKEIERLRELVAARLAGKAPLTVISTPITATCEGGQCAPPIILPTLNGVSNCPNGRCPNQR